MGPEESAKRLSARYYTIEDIASTEDTQPNIECRVKLENGKLCPRRDKVKCPFHGKIIPRDEFGVPIDLIERMTETNQRNDGPTTHGQENPNPRGNVTGGGT